MTMHGFAGSLSNGTALGTGVQLIPPSFTLALIEHHSVHDRMRELLDSLQSNVRPVLDICADTLAYLKALCRNTLLMKGFINEERQIGINIQHNHQNL